MERLGSVMVDDVCVPRTRLADLIEQVEAVAAAHDLVIGVVGHAGDGNFHPTYRVRRPRSRPGQALSAGFGRHHGRQPRPWRHDHR
ncbi:MAG: FAD-linked oxidase C-terminal domain-containing protein [Nocardioidaceae bacterium]